MSCYIGVDWMKRRSKVKFTQIHVSIPVRLLEDFDETLSFTQSRSAKISSLISEHTYLDNRQVISDSSSRQLMAVLTTRDDVDDTLKHLLLQILTKSS